MQEKTMVADTLAGINGELTRYAGMIAQSENKELKQTLKQFRTACEQSGGTVPDRQREVLLCAGGESHRRRSGTCEKPVHTGNSVKEFERMNQISLSEIYYRKAYICMPGRNSGWKCRSGRT